MAITSNGKAPIVFGCQQTMKYLTQQGYFTFFDLLNEKYDTYADVSIRADLICLELTRLKNNSRRVKQKMR